MFFGREKKKESVFYLLHVFTYVYVAKKLTLDLDLISISTAVTAREGKNIA